MSDVPRTFELRWVVPDRTTTDQPKLQYRYLMELYAPWAASEADWSEWADVPKVALKEAKP